MIATPIVTGTIDPIKTLRDNFAVVHNQFYDQGLGKKIHTSTVPGLFRSEHLHKGAYGAVREFLQNGSVVVRLDAIQGHGLTRVLSELDLFDKLLLVSHNGGLLRYKPKEGQASDPAEAILLGRAYRTVHSHQKLHDHSSDRLLDFEFLIFEPFSDEFEPMPYDQGYHMHLLNDEVS